jgi:hypothetical protein
MANNCKASSILFLLSHEASKSIYVPLQECASGSRTTKERIPSVNFKKVFEA